MTDTKMLIIWILIVAVSVFFAYRLFVYRSLARAITGSFKAVYYVILGLAIWMLLPPYGIDVETLFAIPIATYLHEIKSFSLTSSIMSAYAIVYGVCVLFVVSHFYLLKNYIKQL